MVAVEAAGIDLDRRSGRRRCGRARPPRGRLVHGEEIVAVDLDRRQAEAARRGRRCRGCRQRYEKPVPSPYWLFSNTNTAGSCSTTAMFSASKVVPWLEAPSPVKHTATLAGAERLRGQRRADHQRRAAADDAVGAEHAAGRGRRCASSRPCRRTARPLLPNNPASSPERRSPWRSSGRARDGCWRCNPWGRDAGTRRPRRPPRRRRDGRSRGCRPCENSSCTRSSKRRIVTMLR